MMVPGGLVPESRVAVVSHVTVLESLQGRHDTLRGHRFIGPLGDLFLQSGTFQQRKLILLRGTRDHSAITRKRGTQNSTFSRILWPQPPGPPRRGTSLLHY